MKIASFVRATMRESSAQITSALRHAETWIDRYASDSQCDAVDREAIKEARAFVARIREAVYL